METDNVDVTSTHLGMNLNLFKNSLHLFSWFILELCLLIQLLNFTCSWFGLLFVNLAMMFITLKMLSSWILF